MSMFSWRGFATAGIGGFMLGSDSGVIASALARLKATGGAEEDLLACVASASIAGVVLAMTFGGRLVDRLGRVAALRFATGLYLALAPLVLLAPGAGLLLLAVRVGAGAADGLLAMALGVYLTENLPTDVRGKGAVISQLAQTFGNLAGGAVAFALVSVIGDPAMSWRLCFLFALLPAALFWVVVRGLPDESRRSSTPNAAPPRENAGRGAVLLACALGACFALTGIGVALDYSVLLLGRTGLPPAGCGCADVTVKGANLVFTALALVFVERKGRVFLLKTGIAGLFLSFVLAASVFAALERGTVPPSVTVGFAAAFALAALAASFALGPGACTWLVLSEILPSACRARALAASMLVYNLTAFTLMTFFFRGIGAVGVSGMFLFLAVAMSVYFVLVSRFVPETAGRTLAEIEGRGLHGQRAGAA